MQRCVLVIEAGPRSTECAAFSASTLEPIEYFSYAPGGFAHAMATLAAELAKKGLKPVRTLLSIHSSFLFMRLLEIPIQDRRKLQEIISLQAQDLFVSGAGNMVLDGVPLSGGKAVVVGVDRDELDAQLKALNDNGIGASWAAPAMLSKDRLLRRLKQNESVCALIDGDSITVVRDGQPCFFKHLDSVEDLQLSVCALEADGINVEKFYSAGSNGFAEKAGIEAEKAPSGFEHTSLLAVALHYRDGLKGGVNFLERHADPKAESALNFRKKVAVALFCGLVLSWGVYVYLRFQNITGEMKSASAAMEAGFKELFPGEAPKNPEYALEVKASELAREKEVLSGLSRPLDVMMELTKAASGRAGLRVLETAIAGSRINLRSEAGSFDEAAAFREALSRSALVKNVTITDTKPGQSGRVRFGVSASLEAK